MIEQAASTRDNSEHICEEPVKSHHHSDTESDDDDPSPLLARRRDSSSDEDSDDESDDASNSTPLMRSRWEDSSSDEGSDEEDNTKDGADNILDDEHENDQGETTQRPVPETLDHEVSPATECQPSEGSKWTWKLSNLRTSKPWFQ
jgi:hypothetical protein